MIDYENMRNIVVKGLKDYLQCPVIRTNQNEEPPAYPYVSYTITTLASENKGTYGEYSDGQDRKPITQTWSITAQSDKSGEDIELIMKAREWLERVGNLYLNDNNIIVQSVGNVSNRDNVLTMEYEYKHGFDVVFWLFDTVENPITKDDVIESVSFDDTTIEKVDYPKIIEELNAEIEKMNVENKNMNAEIEKKNAEILSLKRRCNVYYPILGEDGYYTDKPVPIPYSVEYNSLLINSDNTFLFSTPEISKDGTMKFSYWNVFKVDENGNKTQEVLAKYYGYNFGLRVVTNCYIEPVYGEKKDSFISIGNATYTREQYTEAGINYDYLYADFIVAFMSPNAELFNQSSKYKTGVIVELNQNAKVTDSNVSSGTFGAVGSTVNYSGITFKSTPYEIEKLATGNSSSLKYKNTENISNIAYKFEIDNSGYNNKNRLAYYVKFKNTQAYRNYVMKAYYYVYEVDESGNAVEDTFKITDEVYFNLYDIGNSDTNTNK